ncbi:MAG: carboxypeptidase [Gammaproteobacteria bacterium]|nr:MAG: carboxypeptidase [Gammaproteobacteria bacterium]
MNTLVKRFSSKFVTQYTRWLIYVVVVSLCSTGTIALPNKTQSTHFKQPVMQLQMQNNNEPKFTKVIFNNTKTMRKFAISFHHALLEINYRSLYAIADLSINEQKKLDDLNISYQDAEEWSGRYWRFQEQLKQKNAGKQLAGIVGFECYATVEETLQQGLDLSVAYPTLSEWIDIGDSWKKDNNKGGYDLMVLKITNQYMSEEKPKLFIHSSMHAREYAPAALTLEFAHRLLEDYNTDADTRWLVDHHEIHILFHMNPDGRKIAETAVLQRKNTNENHCSTGKVGVDLNRNFAYFWNYIDDGFSSSGNECSEIFRGISAESEPETQGVSNYIRTLFADARGDLEDDAAPETTSGMHLDIHSYSELVLWPYGHSSQPSPNDSGFVALGNKLAWFNNYTPQQSFGLYPTDGTSDDVSYGELGIAALTFELGTSFFQDCSVYNNTIKPDNLKALYYSAKASAMPYLLPKGPEVSLISLNGSETGITVSQGTNINLISTLKTNQTKLSESGRTILKAEFSIDAPIWLQSSIKTEITGNDGNLTSEIETFDITIDTSNLSSGEHILYVRGYNQNQQVGVPSAVFINIGENNSPTPSLVFTCTNLSCNYDASGSSDSDGNITNYLWDFNGEETSTSISGSINFASASNKTINLTITDDSNNTAASALVITVTEPALIEESSSSGGGTINFFTIILLMLFRLKTHKK